MYDIALTADLNALRDVAARLELELNGPYDVEVTADQITLQAVAARLDYELYRYPSEPPTSLIGAPARPMLSASGVQAR